MLNIYVLSFVIRTNIMFEWKSSFSGIFLHAHVYRWIFLKNYTRVHIGMKNTRFSQLNFEKYSSQPTEVEHIDAGGNFNFFLNELFSWFTIDLYDCVFYNDSKNSSHNNTFSLKMVGIMLYLFILWITLKWVPILQCYA